MKIKVLSDSTCDLPQYILDQNDITLVPLTVIKADEEFKDGIDIFPDDIFRHVANGGNLCSTSAVSVGEYEELFEKYSAEYDGIILINIGSGFSSCHQNALVAAEDYPKVRCIDSMNLTVGQGFLVMRACQMAQDGATLDEIAQELTAMVPKIETSFLLDRLDYMVKGGRCSTATALGANLLNLKPCLEIKDGKLIVVKKYRGNYAKCLSNYVMDRIANRDDVQYETMFLVHTPVNDTCMSAVKETIGKVSKFSTQIEAVAGCTISCHCGPGTLGVIFLRK